MAPTGRRSHFSNLIGTIAFGIINRCEAFQSSVVLSAKESCPLFAGTVGVDKPTAQVENPASRAEMEGHIGPDRRNQNSNTISNGIVAKADYVVSNNVGDVGPINKILKFGGASPYGSRAGSGVDYVKFNPDRPPIRSRCILERQYLQGVNFHLGTVGCDKFIAGQSQRLKRQFALLASGDPQGCSECRDNKAGDCCQADTVAIHEAATASHISNDDGTDTGVAFFGGMLAFIAAFITYALLEERR
jgi:hypothetical protein